MRVAVLGPVRAWRGDTELELGAPQRRAVLGLLAVRANQVVARDELIDGIWGEDLPAQSVNALHVHVARLRAVLEPGRERRAPSRTLLATQAGYQLTLASGQLDTEVFAERLAAARASLAAGDLAGAAGQFDVALRLWQGTALAGIPGPLAEIVRTRLSEQRLAAAEEHVDVILALGRHSEAVQRLVELVAGHPLRERFRAQLMLALYLSGRQAEALAAFADARRVLAGELGIEPGTELRQLHARILAADPALDVAPDHEKQQTAQDGAAEHAQPPGGRPPAELPPGERPRPAPAQLPADVAAFTGRAAELAALDLPATPSPAVAITVVSGTAGVGKTALAVRWARQAAGLFPDGQLYVNLRGYDPGQPVPPADALAGFLRALGMAGQQIPPGDDERAAAYRSLLDGRRMLVLLDNAASVEQVRPLLPGCPSCLVLVTSRDSLAGLVARHGARRIDLDILPQSDALGLLRALIGNRVDVEPDAAAALAAQCARLPLALRVAAELAVDSQQSSLAELAGELADEQRRLDLLDAGGDARTAIGGVFSWSYRHLPAGAARTFRLAGLHPGSDFDPSAVAALTGVSATHARDHLVLLARAHLIHPVGAGRYGMHDLLRAYACRLAAEQDSEQGDAPHEALIRLYDYYLGAAAGAMDVLVPAEKHYRPPAPDRAPGTAVPRPAGTAEARAWLDAERATLVAVAAHAATRGAPSYSTRLSATLYRYLETGGHYADAVTVHGHASRAARLADDRAAEATALINLGIISWRQGRYPEAIGYQRQAMAVAAATGDRAAEAVALGNLGIVYERQGRYDEASDCQRQALALTREAGDTTGEARAIANLGSIAIRLADYGHAVGWYQQALARFRDGGDSNGLASALPDLGIAYLRLGQVEQAIDCFKQALALFREIGDRTGEAEALNGVGEIMMAASRPQEARAGHAAALTLASQTGDAYEQARAHAGLGAALTACGDVTVGKRHLVRALEVYAEIGAPESEAIRGRLAALERGQAHDPGDLVPR
ncbi:tetratricopeptide repeat protein [Trebonia kvetii]|uniref:Tetratricopeptide repeat protein n=1 Tax=Trebonia kvetii TaxID=2480626 RepID=A0A6P2C685_9ACTN|nr:tetratricopeptide repeat protein [Trebonia kvetii]